MGIDPRPADAQYPEDFSPPAPCSFLRVGQTFTGQQRAAHSSYTQRSMHSSHQQERWGVTIRIQVGVVWQIHCGHAFVDMHNTMCIRICMDTCMHGYTQGYDRTRGYLCGTMTASEVPLSLSKEPIVTFWEGGRAV